MLLFSPVQVALVVAAVLFRESHAWLFMTTVKPSLYYKEFIFACFGGEMRTLAWKPTNYCARGLISVLI